VVTFASGSEKSCFCCGKPHLAERPQSPPRRRFIALGAACAAASWSGGALLPRSARAQTALSPDAALQMLVDGNKRFVDKKLQSFNEDLTILKQNTVAKQEPFAGILSCADSRVPVELVFDQSIGQVFVTRVAGNLATSEIIASLEYGVAVLGLTTIMVLGHGGCGAVKAAMAGSAVPGQISGLFSLIRPAIAESGGDLTTAIKDNAKFQAQLLATASPVLADKIKTGRLNVVAGYYALDSGQVTVL
jgi:carbonic anhydrase